jgi:hypothetical protein
MVLFTCMLRRHVRRRLALLLHFIFLEWIIMRQLQCIVMVLSALPPLQVITQRKHYLADRDYTNQTTSANVNKACLPAAAAAA